MKSDQGGHSNWQHNNLNAYATGPAVDLFTIQRPDLADRYFNNTIIQLSSDGVVGSISPGYLAAICNVVNVTHTHVYTKSGTMPKCLGGPSITATGVGNTVDKLPADDDVMVWARSLLRMPAAPTISGAKPRDATVKTDDSFVEVKVDRRQPMSETTSAARSPLHIVLVLVDELGTGDVSCWQTVSCCCVV